MATIQDIVESRLQDAQTKLAADAARRVEPEPAAAHEPMPAEGYAAEAVSPPEGYADDAALPDEGYVAPPAAPRVEEKAAEDLYVDSNHLRTMAMSLGDVDMESEVEKDASSVAVAAAMLDGAEEEKESLWISKKTLSQSMDAAAEIGAEEGRRAGMRTGAAAGLGVGALGAGGYAVSQKRKQRQQPPVRQAYPMQAGYGGYGGYGKYAEAAKQASWFKYTGPKFMRRQSYDNDMGKAHFEGEQKGRELAEAEAAARSRRALAIGGTAAGVAAAGGGAYAAYRHGEGKGRQAEQAKDPQQIRAAYAMGARRGYNIGSSQKYAEERKEARAPLSAREKKWLIGGAGTALAGGLLAYNPGVRKSVAVDQIRDAYAQGTRRGFSLGVPKGQSLGRQKQAGWLPKIMRRSTYDADVRKVHGQGRDEGRHEVLGRNDENLQTARTDGREKMETGLKEESTSRWKTIGGVAGGSALVGGGGYATYRHGKRKGIRQEQAKDPRQIRTAYVMGARRGYSLGHQKQAGWIPRIMRRSTYDADMKAVRRHGRDEGRDEARGELGRERAGGRMEAHNNALQPEASSGWGWGRTAAGVAGGSVLVGAGGYGLHRHGKRKGIQQEQAKDPRQIRTAYMMGARRGYNLSHQKQAAWTGREKAIAAGAAALAGGGTALGYRQGKRKKATNEQLQKAYMAGAGRGYRIGGMTGYRLSRVGRQSPGAEKQASARKMDDVLAQHIQNAVRDKVRRKLREDLVDQAPGFAAGMAAPLATGLGYAAGDRGG